jgi:hypothetical protein
MAENDNDFDLAWLDQQIEHPAGSLDAEARQLVEDLQRMCRPTRSDIRANAESLRRVQKRLQARFEPAHQETTMVPLRVFQTHQERNSFMHTSTSERRPGWRHFSHTLNTLAAVLVVIVLIGGAAVLSTIRHAQSSPPSTQAGSPGKATATPVPNFHCSRVFRDYPGASSYPDNGEYAICLQKLETPLHGVATLNGHKVTLISAYADANRLIIKYVVDGKITDSYDGEPGLYTVTIGDDAQTLKPDPALNWSIGGGYSYDQAKDQTLGVATYSTQQVPASIKQLQVTVVFSASNGTSPENPGTVETDSFTFTVPFHAERRVATPNQSVVINGHRLTLTQVVVTPSATALYVKTDKALTPSPTSNLMEAPPSATINGNSNVSGDFTTNGIVNGKWDPVTGFSLGAPENWLSQPTTWKMTLRSLAPPLGDGTGTMQFTVPR